MQEREPPWNDILPRIPRQQKHVPPQRYATCLQISIHPRNPRSLDRARKGLEEPVRLPLVRVLTPHRLVRVARPQVQDRDSALGYRNFRNQRAVVAPDRLVERQDGVLRRAGGDACLSAHN